MHLFHVPSRGKADRAFQRLDLSFPRGRWVRMTVLLDIAPDVAAARKARNRDNYERDLAMLSRVRVSYLRQAAQPGWVVVDAARPVDAVAADVASAVWSQLAPR